MNISTISPKQLAHQPRPSPFATLIGYRLDDLEQSQEILAISNLWQELFDEPFPQLPVMLNPYGTAVAITCLLAQLWESRYPIWLEEAHYAKVTHLIHFLQKNNVVGANTNLVLNPLQVDCLQVFLTLGEHYANYFPGDTTWLADLTLLNEDYLSQAVANFLAAINRDYFPVHDDVWLEDIDHLAMRLEQICIEPQGHELDPDFAEDLDAYEEPLRTLLSLVSDEPVEGMPDIPLDDLAEVVAGMPLPTPILDYLPVMMNLVTHNSNNPWLDWSYGDLAQGYFMLPEWDAETVAYLREEWLEAEKLLAKETELIRWVQENLPTRLAAVRSAIYLAFIQTQKGVRHELRPRCSNYLPRSDNFGKSAGRWITCEPSYITS